MSDSFANDMAILVMFKKRNSGLVESAHVYGKDVYVPNLPVDECTRLLVCPWIIPIVATGRTYSTLQLNGVKRHKLKITTSSAQEESQDGVEMNQNGALSPDVLAALKELPEVVKELRALKQAVQVVQSQTLPSPPLKSRSCDAPSSEPTQPTQPTQPTPAAQTITGFKHLLTALERFDRACTKREKAAKRGA